MVLRNDFSTEKSEQNPYNHSTTNIVARLGEALKGTIDGIRFKYQGGLSPWSQSHHCDSEKNGYCLEHSILDACRYLFAVAMLQKYEEEASLDSQAIKLILAEQHLSGWWPPTTRQRFVPSVLATALAIQALCLLRPRGWRLAVLRGVDWIWSQQGQDGVWVDKETDMWLFSPSVDWLTVLVLDAIDLADGKSQLTFTLPDTVTQPVAHQGLGKQSQTKAESRDVAATESSDEIPAARKSAPLSLTRMAQCWGGDMTAKKVRAMIDKGRLSVMPINRQTYVFDTKYLPTHVIDKVKR
jgi:hypothetical protein